MPTLKTVDLEGSALDWAVAKAEGRTVRRDPMCFGNCSEGGYWIWEEVPSGLGGTLIDKAVYLKIGRGYNPSTNWAQGGPLVDKYVIGFSLFDEWVATVGDASNPAEVHASACGATHLIAAMRCLVASKLGDTVEVPDDAL